MATKWGCLERLEVINGLKIVLYYLLGSNNKVKGVELIFYLKGKFGQNEKGVNIDIFDAMSNSAFSLPDLDRF